MYQAYGFITYFYGTLLNVHGQDSSSSTWPMTNSTYIVISFVLANPAGTTDAKRFSSLEAEEGGCATSRFSALPLGPLAEICLVPPMSTTRLLLYCRLFNFEIIFYTTCTCMVSNKSLSKLFILFMFCKLNIDDD